MKEMHTGSGGLIGSGVLLLLCVPVPYLDPRMAEELFRHHVLLMLKRGAY